MSSKWKLRESDKALVRKIKDELKIPEIIATTLVNREIDTVEKAEDFIKPNPLNLFSPFLFKDMEKAVDKILDAVRKNQGILIFGDRDVDGVTSTTILYKVLQKMNAAVVYRIPDGEENYGISKDVIAWAISNDLSLMITVDCGITAIEEVEYANSLGLDIIVTDHHEPREKLPEAYAIINPKINEDNYPFFYLSGAGVVLKLAQALAETTDLKDYHGKEIIFLDIETTGLNPEQDDIIEIGAVKAKDGVFIDYYQTLVQTSKHISPEVNQITGLTNEMLNKDGIAISDAMRRLVEFVGNNKIIGHNIVGFDIRFINSHLRRLNLPSLNNPMEDTLKMAKVMLKRISRHNLEQVARELGIHVDSSTLHRAVKDSEVCAEVYRRLILSRSARINDLFNEYLPLAAIGTVADIMPLAGENRNIVKNGLKNLHYSPIGLISLLREIQLNIDNITSKNISWNIAPLLNSPGRIGDATLSVELLISNKVKEAEQLAQEILEKDKERKTIVHKTVEETMNNLDTSQVIENKIFFHASDNLLRGITGLLANKFTSQYELPAVVISIEGEEATGSVRALGDFDVMHMLQTSSHLFLQYGGHRYAGGFTIKKGNIDSFKSLAIDYLKNFDKKGFETEIIIDDELENFEKLSLNNLKYLENIIEPTGNQNESPNFLIRNVAIVNTRYMGRNSEHVMLTLKKDTGQYMAIAWSAADHIRDLMEKYRYFDIVGTPEINRYQGLDEPRLVLVDISGR